MDGAGSPLRVLFVDDSPDDVRSIESEFRRDGNFIIWGTRVETASALRAALQKHRYDVVLCDWVLPGFDGYEALSIARELHRYVPIIIVSGAIGEAAVVNALRAGAEDFVSKHELARLVPVVERGLREAAVRSAKDRGDLELERAREDFKRAVDLAPDPVFIRRGDFLVYVNPAFLESIGARDAREVLGTNISDLTGEARVAMLARAHRDDRTPDRHIELRWPRPDGTTCILELSAESEIAFEGARAQMTIARDITDRKRLEAQLITSERLASLGVLAAGIAHEINNPLAAMMSNVEMAIEGLRSAREAGISSRSLLNVEAALAEAREASERVRFISHDLRSFARPDEGGTTPVDVCAIMTSSLRLARHATKNAVRVISAFDKVLPVEASEPRLGQVFLNLLVNAGQAFETAGRADSEIRVTIRMHEGFRVCVEVEDNGSGIAPENLERIFTPFFTTKRGSGMGLGLSISRGIVASLKGEISVDSALGRGTRFRILLPVARSASAIARSQRQMALPKRARVLVIDDDPLIGSTIQRLFAPVHDVQTSSSGRAALERLRSGERFDLILSDMEVSEAGSVDLLTELKDLAPDQAARVTFVTRGVPDSQEREFLEHIPNPHIEKPFSVSELRALLSRDGVKS